MRKIRKKIQDYIPFILIIILVFISFLFSYEVTYADKIKIIGDAKGLEVSPKNTKLFKLNNLNPGDTYESEIILENKYTDCYLEIFFRIERASKEPNIGEADLFKQLRLSVYLEQELIYSGLMKDFAIGNISLGNFGKNKSKKMKVKINLPGKETGNEFQGKEVEVNWIFVAQSNCEPIKPIETIKPRNPASSISSVKPIGQEVFVESNKPKERERQEMTKKQQNIVGRLAQTGAISDIVYLSLGGLIVVFGIGVYRKKNKK